VIVPTEGVSRMLSSRWRRWLNDLPPLGRGGSRMAKRGGRRPLVERLEDRLAPATFAPGSIQGQDGWSGGTIAIAPQVDQAVDQSPPPDAHAGVGTWRVSNSTINGGGYNG